MKEDQVQRWSEDLSLLLARGPSQDVWGEICDLLAGVELHEEDVQALEIALAPWPEEIRHAPEAWVWALLHQKPPPAAFRLCRRIAWSRHILEDHPLGPERTFDLAASPALTCIRQLALRSHDIGSEGFWALASSPWLEGLTHLDLDDNSIGDPGVEAFAQSPYLRSLRHLNLWSNRITALSCRSLAHSPLLQTLERLNLRSNPLEGRGIAALVLSPYLKNLRHLDLGFNRIGPKGGHALGRSTCFGRLETLDLIGNSLGDPGIATFPHASFLARLSALDLRFNQIGDEGAIPLLQSPHLLSLRTLRLGNNLLTDETASFLLTSPLLAFCEIDLRSNLFSRDRARQLHAKRRDLHAFREAPPSERLACLLHPPSPLPLRIAAASEGFPYLPNDPRFPSLLRPDEDPRLVALLLRTLPLYLPPRIPPALEKALLALTSHPEPLLAEAASDILQRLDSWDTLQTSLESALFV